MHTKEKQTITLRTADDQRESAEKVLGALAVAVADATDPAAKNSPEAIASCQLPNHQEGTAQVETTIAKPTLSDADQTAEAKKHLDVLEAELKLRVSKDAILAKLLLVGSPPEQQGETASPVPGTTPATMRLTKIASDLRMQTDIRRDARHLLLMFYAFDLWEEARRHAVPLTLLLVLLCVPKLLWLWPPFVLIWSAVEYVYERQPTHVQERLKSKLPTRLSESRAFRELAEGIPQVRPFILIALYGFYPLALLWMFVHWAKRLCGWTDKPPDSKPNSDKLYFVQNRRKLDEEQEENFIHSPAFAITAIALFVCGLPAAITYLLYRMLGVDAMLGFPSHDPHFASVFIGIHLYVFSIGCCLSVLFFRSWFTFPLNFVGNESWIELDRQCVRRKVRSWFMQVLTFNGWCCPGSGNDRLDWKDIKALRFDASNTPLYPLPRKGVPFNNTVYNFANRLAAFSDGISRRGVQEEHIYFTMAGTPDDWGKLLTINLSELTGDERARLLYAVRNWAPHVEIDERCLEKLVGSSVMREPRYTQLWFDLLTDGMKRKRFGLLNTGDTLQNGALTVEKRLASGGQANIYLAVDPDGNKVVLKEFILSTSDGVGSLIESAGEFETESTMLSQLDHRRIVKMLSVFAEDRRIYVVLERVAGVSLRQMVKTGGPLPEKQVIEVALQLLDVLKYLHGQEPSIVHRDLAPDNIILTEESGVKVIDFSLAAGKKTRRTSSTMGKHCYVSPEQFREQACPQSDIFTLGATMYFLLTGADPTPITTANVQAKAPHISDRLHSIIERATALELTDRYPDVNWMETELIALKEI